MEANLADYLNEGFEGGVVPPSGWTTIIQNTSYTWKLHDFNPYAGTYAADVEYDPALVPQNEWLISPSLDLTSVTGVLVLKWYWNTSYYWFVDPNNNGDVFMKISSDGDSTWTTLWSEDSVGSFNNWEWYVQELDITSYGGQSNVKIALNYVGVDAAQFTVDEISIYDIAGPGQASNPYPTDGATGIPITGNTATWTNPAGATSCDVWFGPAGNMTQVHTGSLISQIALPALDYYSVYNWRVDEIDGSGTTTGPVWSFTTMLDPAGVSLPYCQNFDASTFPAFWSQTSTISPIWTVSNTNFAGGSPYEMLASWVIGTGTSRLIVGPINTTGMTNLSLAFKHYYNDFAAGATMKIQSSLNGTTWTDEAFSFVSGGGSIGPETVYTTVTNNVGTTTYIAWVIDGNHYQINSWNVDDVCISQQTTNDVGTFSVDVASSLGSGNISPQATVRNFGTATQTFNVQMTITGGYSSTKTVTNLAPGATQQVTFDNWNATAGLKTINVCTQLGSDENTANDCLSKDVTVFSGSWAYGNSSPVSARAYGGSATYVGDIFIMGGVDSLIVTRAECDKYNVNTNSWTSLAPLPAARDRLTAVTVGGFVYAIGGYDAANALTSTVYKYDIAGNSWTTVAPLPAATGWGQAVAYGNKIYVVGGILPGDVVTSNVYVYDVVSNTWASATSLPGARFGGACSITGNQIVYVAGVDDLFFLSDVVYVGTISGGDPTLITWTTAANKFPGSQKFGNSVFSENITSSLLVKAKKEKKIGEALPYPVGGMYRFDSAPWGTDGIIVATGIGTGNSASCYVYKPGTDTWFQQADVLLPLMGANVGSVNNGNVWKFLLAWGDPDGSLTNNTRTVQIYTDSSDFVPVELTSFTGVADNDLVELSWITATETNNQGFELQRSAGGEFEAIAFVEGHGTTTEVQAYSYTDRNVKDGSYSYRLKQVDFDGTFEYSDVVEVDVTIPNVFALEQNYPNPFNPSTKIAFRLAVDSKVSLKVFDVLAQEVVTLVNTNLVAGSHNVNFDASSLNSGVYFYRIEATGIDGTDFVVVKKMILMK